MEGCPTVGEMSAEGVEPFADDPGRTEAVGGGETPGRHGSQSVEIVPQRVVEALLFASDAPLPPAKLASILGVGDARDVRRHIAALNEGYAAAGHAFRIEEIAGGFRMMTLPAYNPWLVKLLRARQETKLTPASLETLAIVAYKQPCTRADIEAIRGVAAGETLNRLREMNLVKVVGRAEDLGRPMLYGTTRRFLEVFGLPNLEDLPKVEALRSGAEAGTSSPPAAEDATADSGPPVEEPSAAPEAGEAGPRLTLHRPDDSNAEGPDTQHHG